MQNRLRQHRRARNLTLAQVAGALGTTPQTVSRLETEVMTLSTDWLAKFATLFDVDPAALLDTPGTKPVEHLGLVDAHGMVRNAGGENFALVLPAGASFAVRLSNATGRYDAHDILIANRLDGEALTQALGQDALVGLGDGRVLLRRPIDDGTGTKTLIPLDGGPDILYGVEPAWIAKIVMRVSYF